MTVSLLPKSKLLFKHVSPQGNSSLRPHSAALSGSERLSRFLVQVMNLAFTYKMSIKRDEPNSNSLFREGARLATLGGEGPNSAEVGCLRMVFVFPKKFKRCILETSLLVFFPLTTNGGCLTYDNRPQVLEDGTLVLRRLDHRGAGRYACRVETGVGRRTTHFHNSQYLFH